VISQRGKKVLIAALLIGSCCAFAYSRRASIHFSNFSWEGMISSIANVRVSLLVLSLVIIYVAYALRALRWKRFSRFLGPSRFRDVYKAFLMGFTAIFLLGRPGEPIPPLLLARKNRFPSSSMFGIYVLERLLDMAATAVLAGVGLFCFPDLLSGQGENQAWKANIRTAGEALLLSLLVLIALLIYFRLHGGELVDRYLGRWREGGGWRCRLAAHFAGFSDGLQAIRTFPDLLVAMLYTAIHWTLIAWVFMLIVRSFGGLFAGFSFAGAMVVLAFTMVGSTLQFPGVGGGAQVAAFIALNRIFRLQQEPAAAAALVIWLIAFASPCGAGVPLLIREGLSINELRGLGRSERLGPVGKPTKIAR
jgi:uncharacterized protein (TIRG00374 family)